MEFVLLTAVAFVATCVQGVAGMGFGMITVPVLVVVIGAHHGILWGNICGGIVTLMLLFSLWRDINWKRLSWMTLGALPALLGTVFALRFIPDQAFSILVAVIMLTMVLFSLFAVRFKPIPVFPASLSFGFLAGMMSALVAQSGPVMTAYAQATRWKHHEFAATIQPLFLFFNIVVVTSKICFGGQSTALSAIPPSTAIALSAAILLGTVASRFALKIIKPLWAQNLALALAAFGALRVIFNVLFPDIGII